MLNNNESRRQFLKLSGASALGVIASARWVNASEISPDSKLKLRFIVASDLHYGQGNTPYDEFASQLVNWVNTEKEMKGLDALFLNGDLSNDSTAKLLTLRDKHLSKLNTPYYTIKGNHDYVDGKAGSPTESWKSIWGYPANHTVKLGEFIFITADTSAPAKSNVYLAADIDWLKEQLQKHRDAPAIFVMIHIAQRRQRVDGWPAHGVRDKEQVPKGEAVMKLLESTPNVRAVFHGHNHRETSAYISGEKRYFFDSHTGGSWGAKRGYRVVEIYDDHKMVSYQMNAENGVELNRHELQKTTPKK
ncbi:MAG: 3',5'-cyclic AMP phosphodiesterase CpdA [Rubritalea sp.]|jgi:3',5'-cyclic AMP phosphodiesterase CpdA